MCFIFFFISLETQQNILGLKKKNLNEGKPIVMEVPLYRWLVYDQWKIHL